MGKHKNSVILPARVDIDIAAEVKRRAVIKRITVNAWLNWAIRQALRSHKAKES